MRRTGEQFETVSKLKELNQEQSTLTERNPQTDQNRRHPLWQHL